MTLIKVKSRGTDNVSGRRNLIINGDMRIAQRGTSATSVTSAGATYLIDRINYNLSSAGTWTFSQDSDAPSGFSKSFKALCTTATGTLGAGGYLVFYQNFEGQDFQQLDYGSSSAKTVTLSFYVKSNKTGTYQVTFRATDGSTERHIGGTYTVNSSGVWERKTITYVGDTAQAIINNNTRGNTLEWWVVAGTTFTSGSSPTAWQNQASADRAGGLNVNLGDTTNNYWQVTGIQLEVGVGASDFEHRSIGEELALCKRYYHQIGTGDAQYTPVGVGNTEVSFSNLVIFYPEKMRAAPTLTYSGLQIFDASVNTAITSTRSMYAGTQSANLQLFHSGANLTRGRGVYCNLTGTSSYMALNAEL